LAVAEAVLRHLFRPLVVVVVLAEADLQSLDGQDRQLPKHQRWKHYMSQVVEVEVVVNITVVVAVPVVLFTTQQCH
jgi:hypothetical protein